MKNWIIVDDFSTRCFIDQKFKTYEDAWNFLYETFPNEDQEDELDQFYVIKMNKKHYLNVGGSLFLEGTN
jgi:hypothetical protein